MKNNHPLSGNDFSYNLTGKILEKAQIKRNSKREDNLKVVTKNN